MGGIQCCALLNILVKHCSFLDGMISPLGSPQVFWVFSQNTPLSQFLGVQGEKRGAQLCQKKPRDSADVTRYPVRLECLRVPLTGEVRYETSPASSTFHSSRCCWTPAPTILDHWPCWLWLVEVGSPTNAGGPQVTGLCSRRPDPSAAILPHTVQKPRGQPVEAVHTRFLLKQSPFPCSLGSEEQLNANKPLIINGTI